MPADLQTRSADHEKVLVAVTTLLRELAEDDDIVLTDATTASDVEAWDSLMHVNLIIAIESHFRVRFAAKEITAAANVGELVEMICSKLPR